MDVRGAESPRGVGQMKTCPTCFHDFPSTKSNKIYCSWECQRRMVERRYKRTYMRRYRAQGQTRVERLRRLNTDPLAAMCLENERNRRPRRASA